MNESNSIIANHSRIQYNLRQPIPVSQPLPIPVPKKNHAYTPTPEGMKYVFGNPENASADKASRVFSSHFDEHGGEEDHANFNQNQGNHVDDNFQLEGGQDRELVLEGANDDFFEFENE